MWADMALSGVQSLLSNGASFILAGREAKAKKKWQAYNNAMTRLSNANNQNAITTNEILAEERRVSQSFNIDRSKYITQGAAETSAAAAETEGRSVDMVIFDVQRNASMQQQRLQQDYEDQQLGSNQQRRNSEFSMAANIDYSPIPQPNPASMLLGLATDLTKTYKDSIRPRV